MADDVGSIHIRSKIPKTTILIFINHKFSPKYGKLIEEKPLIQDNRIITSKYTLFNFLPKNLFLQFRRVGNFYFLMTTIIQMFTDSPVSPATSLIPLSFVVCVTAFKQAYEDWLRHKADKLTNSRLLPLVSNEDKLIKIQSRDIRLGDIIQIHDEEEIPCDLLLLNSSHLEGNCSITTANLDGETNLKKKISVSLTRKYKTVSELSKLVGLVECEEPNPDLYEFSGILTINDVKENLRADNLLLRGSRLVNTNYIFGLAIYTGKDTKMSLNSKTINIKFSSLEQSINLYLGVYLMLLLSFCLICLLFRFQKIINSEQILEEHWYLRHVFFNYNNMSFKSFVNNFLNFFVLFNYLIPISLYVSLEMTRFFGTKLMIMNKQFEGETKEDILICNCSDINEELGQIKYLFSDKTGTLTENVMKFVSCSINGQRFQLKNQILYLVKDGEEIKVDSLTQEQKFFFVCLTLCNTVSIKKIKKCQSKPNIFGNNQAVSSFHFEYIADSPDEKALVEAAYNLDIKLVYSNENEFRISINDKIFIYEKLKIIEFDSIRKRMSVIIRDPIGRIYLICKGADSELINIIKKGKTKEIYRDIDDFATQGLRTLTIAYRTLTKDELDEYTKLNNEALNDFTNKKEKLEESNKFAESNLTLLGATGIEDKLQEDVENTLLALKKAGIYIWLLTGDKLETAISVAFSCKLIEPEFHLMFLSRQKDIQSCKRCLIKFWYGIKNSTNLEKFTYQRSLNEIEERMSLAVKLANYLFDKLATRIELKKKNLSKIDDQNSKQNKVLIDKIQTECLNKLEEKIDGLIKLEEVLKRLKMFAYKKNQTNHAKKLKLKKIGKQVNKDIEELEMIETCLNTNDYNIIHQAKHHSYKMSSSSINESSGFFLNSKTFQFLKEIDYQNFNLNDELKESSDVTKYLKEKFVLILDGGSLYIALRYHSKLFELVCQHCAVVICSRMSPIQKAQIVKMVKNLPSKPVTAAIGDGANDVSMIAEANVGFGLQGKEGTQAVRNSDFAFSKFKFVKTVLLVHGHYFYVRISHLVHFFFFKNMIFIMPQFIYSFYNMFSGQTIYHGMLLMCYNLLFTATPIFFQSLLDEHIPKFFLSEFPTLYRTLSENACMNINIIIKWITFSTIQGIFIFFSVRFLWPGTVSMLSNGNEIGVFSFGLIIYHIVVLVVNLKLFIMSKTWQKHFIFSLVCSTVMLPIMCLIYSSFKWDFMEDNMYGQFNQLFVSLSFWITVISITFFAILPDIVYSVFEISMNLRNYSKLIQNKNREKLLRA